MGSRSTAQSGDSPSALVIQHLAPEHPGAIGRALEAVGVALDVRRTDLGDGLPAGVRGHAALVIMGGPMSAYSDEGYPTRRAEIELAARAVAEGVPFMGICLGAQILAAAAGASCFPGTGPEIGWAPIEPSADAATDAIFSALADRTLDVFHWHSDTFDLPERAVRLAGSERYANQAFRIGDRAWGLQCHPEVDAGIVDGMLAEFASEIPGERRREIDSRTASALAALRPVQARMFAPFAALARAHSDQMTGP